MPSSTIYSRRLRSHAREGGCRCKVGSCHICGSKCRRCMCSCDGIDPIAALSRSRGGYRRHANAIKSQRESDVAISTKSIIQSNKKRKRNRHFKKVGFIRNDNNRSIKKKRTKKRATNSDDSDSEYVDVEDEKASENENDDDNDILRHDDFSLEIDTKVSSIPDDTKIDFQSGTAVVPEKIKTSRKDISRIRRCKASLNRKKPPIKKQTKIVKDKKKVNQPSSTTRTSNLNEVLNVFDLPNYWIRHIPSFKIRETSINIEESAPGRSFARLSKLAMKMLESSLRLLCPGPGFDNFQSHILNEIYNKKLKQKMLESNNNNVKNGATDNNSKTNPYERTTSEKLDSVIGTLCTWSNKSVKGSIERRVIRAVLNESFLKHEIREMKNGNHKLKQGNGQPVEQARSDADLLRIGHKLSKTLITRQKRTDNTIRKCVDFILSDNNIASVSWGSKVVLSQSLGEVTLPKLTRKTPIHNMYLQYKHITKNDDERLQSTSFYSICNILSANDNAMLSSIDYVSGLLVNETCETLQNVVERLVPTEHRSECTKFITVAKNFMKAQFKDKIILEDDCCFHGLRYALSSNMTQRDNTHDNACKFPFFICDHIKKLVSDEISTESEDLDERTDAVNVIDSISEKFKLFLAHQVRCKCQSVAISAAEEDIKQTTINSGGKNIKALIIMDFKMKYGMRSTRETTIEHFGKRGIGWHGFAVVYYQLDDEGNPTRNIVYLDQILNDTNKQDGVAVVALLEVAITAFILELPFIKEAIITSDNAACYQNHLVTFMMSVYNKKFAGKFYISAFMHTETQDGKSLLDAHFATSNRHLVLFMKTWRSNRVTRINTAHGLAYALSFNLGMKNSMVQLVEIDRERVERIKKIFEKMMIKCGEYYNRANHISFCKDNVEEWSLNEADLHDEPLEKLTKASFTFGVMAFSNVTNEVYFHVNVDEQKLIVHNNSNDNDATNCDESLDPEENIDEISEPIRTRQCNLNDDSDFSTFRISKKLKNVSAFSLLGISPDDIDKERGRTRDDDDDSDSDSDYNNDDNMSCTSSGSESDELDEFFLSKNEQRYFDKEPSHIFNATSMITSTRVCRWLPLGVVRSKKASTNQRRNISQKSMIKGLSDVAVVYAKNNITQNNLFQSRDAIDPIVIKANDFKIKSFENGWAKRNSHGSTYGVSYLYLYESDLMDMYQKGVRNDSSKMSAGKMRENLLNMYAGKFSIPGETEIKQFIGKVTQANKAKDPLKEKSTRGRKAGNAKKSWYSSLDELIHENPSEKPENIFRLLIDKLGNNLPDDLPITADNEPDKKKIKSTIARFKTKLKKDAKRSIVI